MFREEPPKTMLRGWIFRVGCRVWFTASFTRTRRSRMLRHNDSRG